MDPYVHHISHEWHFTLHHLIKFNAIQCLPKQPTQLVNKPTQSGQYQVIICIPYLLGGLHLEKISRSSHNAFLSFYFYVLEVQQDGSWPSPLAVMEWTCTVWMWRTRGDGQDPSYCVDMAKFKKKKKRKEKKRKGLKLNEKYVIFELEIKLNFSQENWNWKVVSLMCWLLRPSTATLVFTCIRESNALMDTQLDVCFN